MDAVADAAKSREHIPADAGLQSVPPTLVAPAAPGSDRLAEGKTAGLGVRWLVGLILAFGWIAFLVVLAVRTANPQLVPAEVLFAADVLGRGTCTAVDPARRELKISEWISWNPTAGARPEILRVRWPADAAPPVAGECYFGLAAPKGENGDWSVVAYDGQALFPVTPLTAEQMLRWKDSLWVGGKAPELPEPLAADSVSQ